MSETPINKIGAGLVAAGLMGLMGLTAYAAKDLELDWDPVHTPDQRETDPDVIREQNRFEELKRVEARIAELQAQLSGNILYSQRVYLGNEINHLKSIQRELLKTRATGAALNPDTRQDLEMMREQNRFEENKRLEARINEIADKILSGRLDWFAKMDCENEMERLRKQQHELNQR